MEKLKQELTHIDDWIFERYNSKYNRLWEHMVQCGLLMIQIIVGYIFALITIQSLKANTLFYSLLFVTSLLVVLSVAIGRIELEKLKTRNYLNSLIKRCQPNQP